MEAQFTGSSCDLEAAFDAQQQDPDEWPGYDGPEVDPRQLALRARGDYMDPEEAAAIRADHEAWLATLDHSPCGCATDPATNRQRLVCSLHESAYGF